MSGSMRTSSAVMTDDYTIPYSQYDDALFSTTSFDQIGYSFFNDSANLTYTNCPSGFGNITYLNISCDNVLGE